MTQLSVKRRIPVNRNRRQGPSAKTERLVSNTHPKVTRIHMIDMLVLCLWFAFVHLADIQQKDREVLELLQERVTLFSDMAEVMGGYEVTLPHCSRNLFRAESPQAPRGEQLLTHAITEGENYGCDGSSKYFSFMSCSRLCFKYSVSNLQNSDI